ncbi:hypothetical protein COY27_05200 [Candidatus Woesearchaeota archaeon CG_4_10_14_0_2_um_filter_33_13]|nr:MAG: hypothetical protein COY27_05200 [Candidatus Woesearchaeota archaeon CG_4_10_14_0_2_um_filter_33_13]
MTFLSSILILVVGTIGLFLGLILAFIAPEELRAGKKYFQLAKLLLAIALLIFINFALYQSELVPLMVVFSIFALVMFFLSFKIKYRSIELLNYAVIIFPYFYINEEYKLIFVSILFVYGLVSGTLFKKILNKD